MTTRNRGAPHSHDSDAAARRSARSQAVSAMKQHLILEAAQRVFSRSGLEGASIRAIAAEAGYTPGAIYTHYPSKEAIYGDLLAASLERLNQAVAAAGRAEEAPARRVRAMALAFYDFYLEHPRELDLGFYLFQGMRPVGLTPELDARLNQRLRDALRGIESGLTDLGWSRSVAVRETTGLFGYCAGLLLLTHTGRIRMFGQHGRGLFSEHLDRLLERVANPE